MGLQLTLPKTDNSIGIDFIDAYWSIEDIGFEPNPIEKVLYVRFRLNTYPNRDCKYMTGQEVPNTGIAYGRSEYPLYNSLLHVWSASMQASEVFPYGVPLSEDEQKRTLYAFVKEYTGLPFEDVIEGEQT